MIFSRDGGFLIFKLNMKPYDFEKCDGKHVTNDMINRWFCVLESFNVQ